MLRRFRTRLKAGLRGEVGWVLAATLVDKSADWIERFGRCTYPQKTHRAGMGTAQWRHWACKLAGGKLCWSSRYHLSRGWLEALGQRSRFRVSNDLFIV